MKIFLWKDLDNLTTSYHCGGSVLVCAATLEDARKLMARSADEPFLSKHHTSIARGTDNEALTKEPTKVWDAFNCQEESIYVMENAECC